MRLVAHRQPAAVEPQIPSKHNADESARGNEPAPVAIEPKSRGAFPLVVRKHTFETFERLPSKIQWQAPDIDGNRVGTDHGTRSQEANGAPATVEGTVPAPLNRPKISCLMVTRQRLVMASRAIDFYAAQDYEPRELVIVSDGHEEFKALREHAHSVCRSDVTMKSVERGSMSLGALRNQAIELAGGEVVCQWDDDDLSHPCRLSAQLDHMRSENASACFLTDHLQLMVSARSLYWCDWTRPRGMPLRSSTVPPTLMCERRAAGRYPETGALSRRSEDATFMRSLLKRCTVAKLSGLGWLYVYVFHGANTWDESHHLRIVRATGMEADDLLQRRSTLGEATAAYGLSSDVMVRDYLGSPVFTLLSVLNKSRI